MKSIGLVTALAVLILSPCCKKNCPPDEKVGSVDLSDTTKLFIPSFYEEGTTLVYTNGSGEKLRLFLNEQAEQIDKLCVETICTELEFDGKSTCKYFDAASHRFVYNTENSDLLMDLLFSMEVAKTKTEYFYDIMTLSLSSADNKFAYAQHYTDIRFDDPNINPPTPVRTMTFLENVQLADTTFTNVYANESDQIKTYYNRQVGLAGFKLNGVVWRFSGKE